MARRSRPRLDGPVGWTAALAGCAINAWTFGVFYSFGLALEQMAADFGVGSASTAAVFGITTFWFFCLGVVSGPLADRFGARPLIMLGAIFIGGGLLLTSRVDSIELAYFTYGIGVGTGIGLYLVPVTIVVGAWFEKRRASALGVTTAGIGIGTVVLVPLAERLIRVQGWRDAFEIMGVGSAIVYVVGALLMARPEATAAPAGGRAAHVRHTMRIPAFWRMYGAGLLMSIGLFGAFALLATYAKDNGVSADAAARLIVILGVGSVAGRLLIGPIAARTGVMPPLVLSFAVQPVAYLVWWQSGQSYLAMAIFAGLLGVGYGGYVALSPVAAAEIFGLAGLGGVLGVLYTSAGVGGLVGAIALAAIVDGVGFEQAIVLSIGLSGLATAVILPVWLARDRSTRARSGKGSGTNEPLVFGVVWNPMDDALEARTLDYASR